ncbi:hypothetical protein Tco_0555314, partial [Tanacetum coccineum]
EKNEDAEYSKPEERAGTSKRNRPTSGKACFRCENGLVFDASCLTSD